MLGKTRSYIIIDLSLLLLLYYTPCPVCDFFATLFHLLRPLQLTFVRFIAPCRGLRITGIPLANARAVSAVRMHRPRALRVHALSFIPQSLCILLFAAARCCCLFYACRLLTDLLFDNVFLTQNDGKISILFALLLTVLSIFNILYTFYFSYLYCVILYLLIFVFTFLNIYYQNVCTWFTYKNLSFL